MYLIVILFLKKQKTKKIQRSLEKKKNSQLAYYSEPSITNIFFLNKKHFSF